MRQGVSILVVLPRETLNVVLAGRDGALLWSLVLMCKHVGLQVLEDTPTLGKGAEPLLACIVIQLIAATALATCAGVLGVE